MRTLTDPGFGIKTKWRRGAAHNGGGATTPNDNSYFMDAWHDHVSMSHTKYGKDSQQLIVAVHCQSMDVR